MTPEDSKILTTFVGKCRHEWKPKMLLQDYQTAKYACVVCKIEADGWHKEPPPHIDFTTPDGFQLLADEIGSYYNWWDNFEYWFASKTYGHPSIEERKNEAVKFHRKQPAYKAPVILEAIKAKVFGGDIGMKGEITRVKAAAIRDNTGAVHTLPAPARHNEIIKSMFPKVDPEDERGFLLSDGRFVDRVKAKRIAEAAGQLLPDASTLPKLYSEDVW